MTRVSQLWDLIETWGFRVDDPCDFLDIPISPHKKITKPNITQPLKICDFYDFFGHNKSLGLDRDLEFSRGHQGRQGHKPHDDEKEEVEDNDKDNDNNKDDNNDKGISALGLDRDLGFSRG